MSTDQAAKGVTMSTVYAEKSAAKDAAAAVTRVAVERGSTARFIAVKCEGGYRVRRAAQGVTTVVSSQCVECHAATYYSAKDVQSRARAEKRDTILRFWESQGVARRDANGDWEARDMVKGGAEWLPLATRRVVDGREVTDAGRADRIELSHVVATVSDGAWCACNLLPESGASNAARPVGMPILDLSMAARALLAAWPAWWRENVAKKSELARVGA